MQVYAIESRANVGILQVESHKHEAPVLEARTLTKRVFFCFVFGTVKILI